MRKSTILLSSWLVIGVLVAVGFNNCGQVAFQVSESMKAAARNELMSLSNIQIENGAEFTRDHQVSLQIFSPRAVQMKISNNPDCSDGNWETYATAKSWTLPQSNARESVFAQFKDELDQLSGCVSDDIVHDDIPPHAVFAGAAGLVTNQSALRVDWTATDNLSGVDSQTCLDTTSQSGSCANSLSTNSSGDGTKTVTVKVKDRAGNEAAFTYSWMLDTTPPQVVINSRPALRTKDGNARFEFSGSDSGSGIDKYFCRKLPAAVQPCTSPITYSGLTDGDYGFEVYAVDKAGNMSAKVQATWSVIMTAPGLAFTKTPPQITNLQTAPFAFTGTDAAHPIARFDCRLDSGGFAGCVSPDNLTGVSEGTHTFEVKGSDDVGNSASIVYSWVVDLHAPVVNIVSAPGNPTNSTAAAFTWTVTDNIEVKTIECRVDSAAYAACPATGKSFTVAEGRHTLDLRATDTAGNVTNVSRAWVVDTTAPVVTITQAPDAYTTDVNATLAFTADTPADIAKYECRLDAGSYTSCASPYTAKNLTEAGHSFFVRATDTAGNMSQPASATWTIDRTPPTITVVSAPAAIKTTDRAIVQFTVNDAGSGTAAVMCGLTGATLKTCPNAYQADLGLLAAGSYSYKIMATDNLGNAATKTVEFQVSAVEVTTCKADEVLDPATNKCVAFACASFVEIKNFPAAIPERASTGVCYYSKLYDAVPNGPSSGSQNTNILSRRHGGAAGVNGNPYILGPGVASRQFTLNGPRAVKLSGDYRSLAPIKVDNYFLVGQRLASDSPSANGWNAYGTSDATIYGQNYILAYNTPVVLQAFASGGTASVNALLLTQYFQPQTEYVLDVHALDCGGSKELSVVYLVWQ
jgi:hypothetical protein